MSLLLAVVSVLPFLFDEILADFCKDNILCHIPYKCCETKKGCCYDSMLHSRKQFHLQIWNMWYFWFLIIFMMMSCFGGCGYYRRRHLAMLTRLSTPTPVRPVSVLASHRRSRGSSREYRGRQFSLFAYSGPRVCFPHAATNSPPAYSEVVSDPGMYPVNKVELPPYPGNDKPEELVISNGGASTQYSDDSTLPPPYTEFHNNTPHATTPSVQSALEQQPSSQPSSQGVDNAYCMTTVTSLENHSSINANNM